MSDGAKRELAAAAAVAAVAVVAAEVTVVAAEVAAVAFVESPVVKGLGPEDDDGPGLAAEGKAKGG